jgi:hypothetical protein
MCVDVTAITTLGPESGVTPWCRLMTALSTQKQGECHFKEQQKKATGNKIIDGTDLNYLPALHQVEGMFSTLDCYLAECKFSPDPGS